MDAIYARQSVEKKDSLSIQGQIDLCRQKTSENFKVYQDKGYSGKNTNRPDFQKMFEDVESGLIQKIVVYRLDRFSRSIADFGRLWEILQKHKVEFVSINETFDTSTPMGRAMLNIIMVFAQLERETTALRVRDNYYQRAKFGSWPGGPPPYGFSISKIPIDGRSKVPVLLPNENAETVTKIFEFYAKDGESLGSVAKALRANQIPGPKRKAWDNVTLSRIIHSPLYVMANEDVYWFFKGKGVNIPNPPEEFDGSHAAMLIGKRDRSAGKYNDVRDQHLSLAVHQGFIQPNVWLACQYKLSQNKQIRHSGSGKHTWLSGLIKCAKCGYSVKVNNDGKYFYFTCTGRTNLKICDASIHVNLRKLEASIQEEVEALLDECDEPEVVDEALLTPKIAEIDLKIERLMDALAESSDVTMDYINKTIEKLEREKCHLLSEQEKRKTKPKIRLQKIKFADLDFEQKKVVIQQFVKEIRLSGDAAEVLWNV